MWNIFNQRRELNQEVYAKLRPGDLYGGEHATGRQPEELVRYLVIGNATVLTFFSVILSRVEAQARGHEEINSAVWLSGMGIALALGSWVLFRLSRSQERKAIDRDLGDIEASALPADVKGIMKSAAIKKLLGFRVMIVGAISACIALYVGIRGLFVL